MKQKIVHLLKRIDRKDILRAMAAGFILTVVFSMIPFFAACENISNDVLRLHVLANSDSEEDQQLKLSVRDAVLAESSRWYKGAADFEEANAAVCTHIGSIQKAAEEVVKQAGRDDDVRVQVTDMYFTTRDYEDFSLPAGKYRTLRVTIGEGAGKNWWCIVYPSLCLPVAEEGEGTDGGDPLAALPGTEEDIITNPGEYQVRFKVVEWYEAFKSLFDQ